MMVSAILIVRIIVISLTAGTPQVVEDPLQDQTLATASGAHEQCRHVALVPALLVGRADETPVEQPPEFAVLRLEARRRWGLRGCC